MRKLAVLVACGVAMSLGLGGSALADGRPGVVTKPDENTPFYVVQKVFEATRKKDFEAFLAWVHPAEKVTPRQRRSLEKYSWKQLTIRVNDICDKDDQESCIYTVTRVQDLQDGLIKKIFILKNLRPSLPCPMKLQKVPEDQREVDGKKLPEYLLSWIGCI